MDIRDKDGKIDNAKVEKRWTKIAEGVLLNKKIVKVEYLTEKECETNMWYKRPICFKLDDGTWVIAQMDDEGNDGGVLWYTKGNTDKGDVIPEI